MATERKYKTFKDFYPFYLTQHQDPTCQELHFTGTAILLVIVFIAILTQKWALLGLIPLVGYGFAWVGHFFFEKNKPATFQYPLYSLGSDFVMFYHILTNQIGKKMVDARKTINGEKAA
jgi:hypothetical protein